MIRECLKCHKVNDGDAKICTYCASDILKYGKVRNLETKHFENASFERVKEWLNTANGIEIYSVKSNLICQGSKGLFSNHNWMIHHMEVSYYCDNPKHTHYDMVWGFGYDALYDTHDGMNTAQNEAYGKADENKIVYAYSRKAPYVDPNEYQDNCCLLIVEK